MADKLNFSLVSPERELFSGEVNQVDIPGTEGDMGIFANHSPTMAAIRTGIVSVHGEGGETHYFVQGGFADVTPDGLTILAEQARALSDLDKEQVAADIDAARAAIAGLEGEAALLAQQNLDGLEALVGRL